MLFLILISLSFSLLVYHLVSFLIHYFRPFSLFSFVLLSFSYIYNICIKMGDIMYVYIYFRCCISYFINRCSHNANRGNNPFKLERPGGRGGDPEHVPLYNPLHCCRYAQTGESSCAHRTILGNSPPHTICTSSFSHSQPVNHTRNYIQRHSQEFLSVCFKT